MPTPTPEQRGTKLVAAAPTGSRLYCVGARNIEGMATVYLDHVNAMTGEGLHSKSDIAAELAYRDTEIDRLQNCCASLAAQLKAATAPCPDAPSARPTPEQRAIQGVGSASTGSDVRRIPKQIESALIAAGWWYTNPAIGWTKDGVSHYMLWEDATAHLISKSAYNPNKSSETPL